MPGFPKRYHAASLAPSYFALERYGELTMERFSSARTLSVGRIVCSAPPDIISAAPRVSSTARNFSAVGTSRMLGSTLTGWPSASVWFRKSWIAFLRESAESAELAPVSRFLCGAAKSGLPSGIAGFDMRRWKKSWSTRRAARLPIAVGTLRNAPRSSLMIILRVRQNFLA